MELTEVGSLGAGQKFFVFQGHLSPPTDPQVGFFRWGTDEIFNLRANDSSDFVRIVDAQGNTVDQLNCEGLPPGATPAPTTEFDPPPASTPVAPPDPTPTPTPLASPVAAAVVTGAAQPTPARAAPAVRASESVSPVRTEAVMPVTGGPPSPDQRAPATPMLAAGAFLLASGLLLVTSSLTRAKPGK